MSTEEFANNNHVKLTELQLVESEFGLPLEVCYKKAIKYYKEKERSGELTVPYEDRVRLMALSKQVRQGPYSESSESAGWFDFVGSDITKAWQNLGSVNKEEAMASFVFMIDRVCPPFKNFIADAIEPIGRQHPESAELKDLSSRPQVQQPNWEVFEAQRKQIQAALNAQTYHQFSAYAQQQFPQETEQQEALIRQLQEQHYQQYMAQVYAQQAEAAVPDSEKKELTADERRQQDDDSDVSDEEPGDDLPLSSIHAQMGLFCHSNPEISPASLWNRKDIQEFKNNIKKEGTEGIIKVGHGETVTIRVPTHEDGTCLFWEFATDHYDIGFGVYFEWSIADNNQVSIHVSESDDEDEYEEGVEEGLPPQQNTNDVETGSPTRKARDPSKPRQDEIIPVYRRDCHEEVYAGSHAYPGRGVYLLKFDNSYSLWRSKTLYYRVYYSK